MVSMGTFACRPADIGGMALFHGIRVGDTIAVAALPCSDGKDRLVGIPNGPQLITFATGSDCASCSLVLPGLEEIWRKQTLGIQTFFVSYMPRGSWPTAVRFFKAQTSQPVCFDTTGYLWVRYNISHTPFTVLLRNGVVAFGYDGPLDSPQLQRQFVQTTRRLSKHLLVR